MLTGLGALGVTAGSHRLWAHQTYTANKALKIFLMIAQTLAGQVSWKKQCVILLKEVRFLGKYLQLGQASQTTS